MSKLLILQNLGGFYGCTAVRLDDAEATKIEKALSLLGPNGSASFNGKAVSWQMLPFDGDIATFETGGSDAEHELLTILGIKEKPKAAPRWADPGEQ